MTRHRVIQGDCLFSIAKALGFQDWATIYSDSANEQLRQNRPNPCVLEPGDRIAIPTQQHKHLPGATGEQHVFRAGRHAPVLRLALEDDSGEPLAGVRYELGLNGTNVSGQTSASGELEEPLPAELTHATLTVHLTRNGTDAPVTWQLDVGHLDPVECATGVQARLRNLGYDTGPVDGIVGPLTRRAVRAFQRGNDLAVDAIPGPNTQAKLDSRHGC